MEDRFALLIDADNVSAKYIKPILDELSKYGNVTYKRIYGDWTKSNSASWKEELLQNSITPIQQFSYTQVWYRVTVILQSLQAGFVKVERW